MPASRRRSPGGGSSASGEIESWVQANFAPQSVDGVTIYDLTAPA